MANSKTDNGEKMACLSGLSDTFYHSLDPKRRLTIPSEWRAAMGNPEFVYIFPDMAEECLNLIPVQELTALLDKMRQKALFDPKADAAREAIMSHAQMLKLDVQGRIRINDDLLNFADIKSGVTLVGGGVKGRLWATEKKPKPTATKKIDVSDFRKAMAAWNI